MPLNRANIRSVINGAKRTLGAFQRALRDVRAIKISETQRAGRVVFKRIGERYEVGQYANAAGAIDAIRPYSAAHGARKARLRLDTRPGVMRKGILRQVKNPRAFSERSDGFVIDIKRPNMTVTGRATVGRSLRTIAGKAIIAGTGRARAIVGYAIKRLKTNKRSFRVNDYIDHFADQKAPGLGHLADEDLAYMEERANAKVAEMLERVEGAAKRFLSGKARVMLKVNLRRLAQ